MEIDAERTSDFAREELTGLLTADATDDLANEVTLVQRVIARLRAGLPPWLLCCEHRGRFFPVVDVVDNYWLRPRRHARSVRHEVTHFDCFFAVGRELGPVLRNGSKHIELAAVNEHQGGERGHRLGGRPHVGDGVGLPRLGLFSVGPATPNVDHRSTVDGDRNRCANVGAGIDACAQQIAHCDESIVERAMNLSHDGPPSPGPEHRANRVVED